jgi:hypothetical protein
MFNRIAGKLKDPKTVRRIKVTAVVVGAVATVVVVGVVLYKSGVIGNSSELVEELISAAEAA